MSTGLNGQFGYLESILFHVSLREYVYDLLLIVESAVQMDLEVELDLGMI